MTKDEWIQVSIAFIAIASVFVALANTIIMKRQLKHQHEQWEYSVKPVFRIIKIYHLNHLYEWTIFFENTNDVYHKIDKVSFSSSDVVISDSADFGWIKHISKDEIETYKDTVVILRPKTDDFIVGTIKIEGVDLIGNRFEIFSPDVKFKNKYIENKISLDHKYFTIR
ncbi:hypothetical protein CSV71_08025 [Sporosarcina sp. P21c]|uniref:hypothetical protein n=1 Tax=unclassified Sporosarcina TaxID=2647733 RepID=UPI000C16881A|nr:MULTISPECIES: hypothetical protein [unclassified Sporosarcina]PIC66751.1 hypothetical protein CSV78_11245 [Sporosarcina sp. P16a]PIC89886.1 hypothetical protein CSV71_08025 [Sporosarcina sp. P21c]PIC93272.1 hypothetical protein CSV70_06840 [Sporosarcina sp. P25]